MELKLVVCRTTRIYGYFGLQYDRVPRIGYIALPQHRPYLLYYACLLMTSWSLAHISLQELNFVL